LIAEIVSIGTELLLGEIVDTNASHIARQLADIGIDHYYTTTVGDNEVRIAAALRTSLGRSDAIITTGGLGPTVDDVTRQAVAAVAGVELVESPRLLAQIEAFFRQRAYPMTDNNRRQALIPEGGIAVDNPVGTAPAFIVELEGKAIICLPGVPREMEYLVRERVVPYLRERMGETAIILSRYVHTVAIGESAIDQALYDLMHHQNPTVGTRAHPGQTDVCITAKATTRALAAAMLDDMEARVRQRLGDVVFGVDEDTLPGVVASALAERGLKLAVGDCVTGGAVADQISNSAAAGLLVGVHVARNLQELQGELVGRSPTDEDASTSISAALLDQHHADVALVLFADQGQEEQVVVALDDGRAPQMFRWPSRGRSEYALGWTTNVALDRLRRWLQSAG
jgi:nicotinamide-nucleotide amidase